MTYLRQNIGQIAKFEQQKYSAGILATKNRILESRAPTFFRLSKPSLLAKAAQFTFFLTQVAKYAIDVAPFSMMSPSGRGESGI